MNVIKENIDNLTSLWRTVSEPYRAFHSQKEFDYAWLEDSEWPNRLWFGSADPDINIPQLRLQLMHLGHPLKIPYWETHPHDHMTAFQKEGFQPGTVQLGMSMVLEGLKKFPTSKLEAMEVSDVDHAEKWSMLFQQAFGYYINPKQVLDKSNTTAYLYFNQSETVGTGLLHFTNQVAGIHSIGVPPDQRRKGFAENIMFHLLNEAIEKKCTLSTLQASDLGKGLYLKLGYQEDFTIHNYVLGSSS